MKSFLKEIEKKFENYESELTETSRDNKKFRSNQSTDSKLSPRRWQDDDGDGIWYEPGADVKNIEEGYYSSSPLETIIGSLGYRQGFEEFFQDNSGAVDVVVEWIISINDFRNQLMKDFDRVELERMGIYDLDEASTSGAAGAYMTAKAFGKADDDTIEALGYKRVQEAMDSKYERLIEGYKTFALSDPKMSPDKKVNASIKAVAKQLKEIEDAVKYTSRLKTESGISHSGFGSSTSNALRKISERLIKISERVRSLGE
jgi:hypothetical protein